MNIIETVRGNQDYFENFITRSTYNSNAIEGNTLSYVETYAILWNDNSFTVKSTPRELYEAINHKYALSYAMEHINEPLNKTLICHIAELINKNIDEISGYRRGPVFLRGAEHLPSPANQVPQAMMYLLHNIQNTAYSSAYEKAADFHLQFERIHPFSDGNGRTGRILINLLLMKENKPPIVIEKGKRSDYFKLLADCNTMGLCNFFQDLSEHESEVIAIFREARDQEREKNATRGRQ